MSSVRGKSTPASTPGSFTAHSGSRSRVQPDRPAEFSEAEVARFKKAGIDAETAVEYHESGIQHTSAIIAWASAGFNASQAATLIEEGSPGPAAARDIIRAPHRHHVDNLAGLRSVDAPGWPGPYQTAHNVTGRRWDGAPVNVTCHVGPGLPSFQVVGMSGEQQGALRDRVRAAILSSGYTWPQSKITLSGVPAADSRTDAAFAVAILQATGQITSPVGESSEVWGELGLDGTIHDSAG